MFVPVSKLKIILIVFIFQIISKIITFISFIIFIFCAEEHKHLKLYKNIYEDISFL